MAMTLAEMKVGMSDKVAEQVVDTFLRESEILQLLPFDNCVSPTGGSTLTYSYVQKKLPATAEFRAINSEYTTSQTTLESKTANLKIFGGAFEMDRVLKNSEGKYNNMAFQLEEKIKAAISLFHYTLINGNTNSEMNEGLYTVKEVDDSTFSVNEDVVDEKDVLVTKVEYPDDVKLGVVNMLNWDLNNRDKVGVQSETISRHSVTYFNMDGDNSIMGYPKSLLGFLNSWSYI